MTLPKNIQDKILTVIKKNLVDNYKVILFGSYAMNKENQYSDIDIAIEAGRPLETSQWSLIEESFEESSITQKIDVIDYHRVRPEFRSIIDKEGIVIIRYSKIS